MGDSPIDLLQGAMDMFKDASTDDINPAIHRYLCNRQAIDELEAELKELKGEKENLEKALIQTMQAKGLGSVKTDEGVGISIVNKTNYSVPDDRKEDQIDYCLDNDMKMALSVHFQRWGSIAKELEGEGKLPEWVKKFEYKTLSVRGR
jgi:hypothetical protein